MDRFKINEATAKWLKEDTDNHAVFEILVEDGDKTECSVNFGGRAGLIISALLEMMRANEDIATAIGRAAGLYKTFPKKNEN